MLADNLRWVEATSDDGERREEVGDQMRCTGGLLVVVVKHSNPTARRRGDPPVRSSMRGC
jgi:hypothetical protein